MRIHNQPCDRLCDGNQMGNRLPSEWQRENLKVSRSNWVISNRNWEYVYKNMIPIDLNDESIIIEMTARES